MTAFAQNAPYTRQKVLAVFDNGEKLTTREIMERMEIHTSQTNLRRFAQFLHNYMEYAHLKREVIRKQGETVQRVFWRKI